MTTELVAKHLYDEKFLPTGVGIPEADADGIDEQPEVRESVVRRPTILDVQSEDIYFQRSDEPESEQLLKLLEETKEAHQEWTKFEAQLKAEYQFQDYPNFMIRPIKGEHSFIVLYSHNFVSFFVFCNFCKISCLEWKYIFGKHSSP
jgi:hypothetical protein